MNQLTKHLVDGILNEDKKEIVALYAGGFKPPTAGHFQVVEEALDNYPEIDKFIVFVGSGVRDGIEQAESILTWEIYQNYLPMKVEITPAKKPAIAEVYSYAKSNPEKTIYWILGARDGDEGDLSDISTRTKSIDKAEDKYNNVEVKIITTPNASMSGTNARKALIANDKEAFFKFIPAKVKEKEEIFNILKPAQTEQLTEHSMGDSIDLEAQIDRLTQHMIDKGYNIEPLPSLEFIDDDHANAGDFLGKTAYYDPNAQAIVLYTHGRHPKDIARSYAHEMIHHIQNLEGRLGNLTTTNTHEDDKLNDLEAEANLKGTMTFRNWTDSLDEGIDDQLKQYIDGDVDVVDVDLLNNLLKFKSKNPEDLDPRTGGNKYGYRGMTFDKDFIKTLNVKNKSNGTTEYEVPSNTKITSKNDRGFLSFSTDEEVAKGFGHYSGYVDHNKSPDKVGGYVKVSLDNPNFILHPDYVGKLSQDLEYSKDSEKETLYIGNSFNPESIYVIDKNLNDSLDEGSGGADTAWIGDDNETITLQDVLELTKNIKIVNLPTKELATIVLNWDDNPEEIERISQVEISSQYPILIMVDDQNKIQWILDGNHRAQKALRAKSETIPAKLIKPSNLDSKARKILLGIVDEGKNKDPFGLNAYARELALGLEEAIVDSKLYPFKVTDRTYDEEDNSLITTEYKFTTPNNTYRVEFYSGEYNPESKTFDLSFGVDKGELNTIDTFQMTGEGNARKIFKTILDIVEDFINKEDVEKIVVDGTDEKRKRIYKILFSSPSKISDKIELKEAIVGDKIECDNCDWSWDIKDGGDDLYICHECGHDNTPQLNEGRYDKSANEFSKIVFETFKDIHDRGDKRGEFEFSVGPNDEDIYSEEFEFDLAGVVEITDDEYEVDGGANAGFDKKGDEITPLLSVSFKIPKNPDWQRVSFDIKDVVRHELEHLTQDGANLKGGTDSDDPKLVRPSKYMEDDKLFRDMIDADLLPKADYFRLEKEIDAMMQGLYFKAKKSKRPFKDVIDDYLDTQPISKEEKEDILNLWRRRRKALSLPVFENEKEVMDYTIYLDMDGVLVDFDKQFEELTGMAPSAFEAKNGSDEFWEAIDGAGVGFWRGMKWMPGGEALYNRASQAPHFLLSSPSRSDVSKIGKHLWRRDKTPSTKLILARSYNKKNYANPSSILIDDRESNINQWREAGGIGILYTSAEQVNRELDKLGL